MAAREFDALAMQRIRDPFHLFSSLSLPFDRAFETVSHIILRDLTTELREMATNCALRIVDPLHDLRYRRWRVLV